MANEDRWQPKTGLVILQFVKDVGPVWSGDFLPNERGTRPALSK